MGIEMVVEILIGGCPALNVAYPPVVTWRRLENTPAI
jgi:hypothetical protein